MKCLFYPLLSILLLLCTDINAQGQEKSTEPCNCQTVFNDLIVKLEHNYIGLAQMKLTDKYKTYEAKKAEFANKSASTEAADCTALLNEFLDFFEDGHLAVFEYPNYVESELKTFKEDIKGNKIDKASLEELKSAAIPSDSSADKILGKWADEESTFIIVKDKNDYKAYIAHTEKEGIEVGECKAIFTPFEGGYKVTYYSYKYSPRYVEGGVYKDGALLVLGNIIWKRIASDHQRELAAIDETDFSLPTLTKLDDHNTLLSIPSFMVDYNKFKTLLEENESTLMNTKTLIVDIRGNRGGNAIYFPLIEMYATQDMEGGQGLVLASEDTHAYFEKQKKYSSKIYGPVVKRIEQDMGKIVDGPLYPGKKFKRSKSKIQHVAILTDEACMSAAESFILHSKRSSSLVKTFGSPTNGVIDYTSVNGLLLDSGKQYIYFGYPTSTLHKEIPENGYNATGIIPDVPIDDEVSDKIDFIVDYFK